MTKLVKNAVIRKRGKGEWELVLDGQIFPWQVEREPPEVENLVPEGFGPPLYALRIGILVDESVDGLAGFVEFLAEEEDSARVRAADLRDLGVEIYGSAVALADFWEKWGFSRGCD